MSDSKHMGKSVTNPTDAVTVVKSEIADAIYATFADNLLVYENIEVENGKFYQYAKEITLHELLTIAANNHKISFKRNYDLEHKITSLESELKSLQCKTDEFEHQNQNLKHKNSKLLDSVFCLTSALDSISQIRVNSPTRELLATQINSKINASSNAYSNIHQSVFHRSNIIISGIVLIIMTFIIFFIVNGSHNEQSYDLKGPPQGYISSKISSDYQKIDNLTTDAPPLNVKEMLNSK